MELSGTWQALVANDELRRTWLDQADDGRWEPIDVPGHWRSTPAFSETDGPLLYRHQFDHDRPAADERHWLVLDGVFYQGDVWLDGGYVGDTEGYFFPHEFEVTDALSIRAEHVLGVEATCGAPTDRTAKKNITGVFQHWDSVDPDWNPGGIWRSVRIERSGPVRIRHLRVTCQEASEARAVVAFRAVLDVAEPGEATICSSVGEAVHSDTRQLAAGENQVEWTVPVVKPALWWPHALGEQALHDVTVEVTLADGSMSDRRDRRIGLRQVSLRNWVFQVNGEQMFLKGSNQGPTRMALGEATEAELVGDIALAKEAGLDLLRLHAHIGRPETYEAADEAGMLLWQDFPLQWGYARSIRKQAVRQVAEAVDQLGHHPSVVVWCGHNEPLALDIDPGGDTSMASLRRRFVVGQELPSWNKTLLDRSVKRAFEKVDGTRPVIAHSGVLPHPPTFDGTDSHLYFGWYHGDERDLPVLARAVPRMVRFVSEFGAQAVPATADFCEPERWPDLDWDRLAETHALQKAIFDRHVPPADYGSFAEWQAATQTYQATVVRRHIETLRRLKYSPTGGFAQFAFADSAPSVSWAVLGHDRKPKAGYFALQAACAPVIVVADRLPASVAPGHALALDVHVVSDRRAPIEAAEVEATLRWQGGSHRWRWADDVPADSCVRVGTIQFIVPDIAGLLILDLTVEAGKDSSTNTYQAIIARPN